MTNPLEQLDVHRLRFDLSCELHDESLFATESELNGVTLQQLLLPIGPGERPIQTIGPLFDTNAERSDP